MSNSMAPSRVQLFQPPAHERKKPQEGEKIAFTGADSTVAFTVTFKSGKVVFEKMENGKPDVTRRINQKFGNVRTVEAQLYEVADMIREHLFGIKDNQ